MNKLYISFAESLYLIYMFHFFQTSVDFNIMNSPTGYMFEHLIGNERGLRICPFGRIAVFILIFIFIGRNYFYISQSTINCILVLTFIISLVNLNALIYILPILFIEFWIIFYNHPVTL